MNDASRNWWEISKVLVQIGIKKATHVSWFFFTSHSSAGMLSGVICLHVDDMLGFGDDLFRQKFDHCGRQSEKHPNGEITISMKARVQNLQKVCLARERIKQLDEQPMSSEA